jgi:hypothetical protein
MDTPKLIETGVYNHIRNTLHNCREHRSNTFYVLLNVGIFSVFVLIIGIILYVCYNQKKTPYEIQQKQLKDQEYVLSKIRFYQGQIRVPLSSGISGLPGPKDIDEPVSRAYPF